MVAVPGWQMLSNLAAVAVALFLPTTVQTDVSQPGRV
jgi:hypothetical protein